MKTVIEMANEAGLEKVSSGWRAWTKDLAQFAELVRADERAECAVIAETAADYLQNSTFEGVAAAIRAMGTHE